MCQILKEKSKRWTISLTGGEPFLCPDFIGICKELTKEFQIQIGTNLSLSSKVQEFADTIDPDKVKFISASLHIEEKEKMDGVEDFIKNVLLLKERKFNIRVNYILHPTLIRRFEKDYNYFSSRGIELLPKPFKGLHMGKNYPKAYSDSEKELILKYNPRATFYPFCFKGIKCNAGKTFIRINENGIVTRCVGDETVLGDISTDVRLNDSAKPCKVYKCSCHGYDLIERNPCVRDRSNLSLWYNILSHLASFRKNKRHLLHVISFVLASFKRNT